MMNNKDKISVLMGIYNCADTLEQAVRAIQSQTYTNWELILCDDGSSDNSWLVAKKISQTDNRIILLKNERNCGLNKTLNHCFSRATGEYIARMDGDDDCAADRFEKQIRFLENQTKFDIVSTAMIFFDEKGEWGRNHVKATPTAEDIAKGSPICHAPVMMRRRCLESVNGYTESPKMLRVEDVNLWFKLYEHGYRCYNINEPLYRMRNDQNAVNRRKYRYRINEAYVRLLGCKNLNLNFPCYMYALKPLISGLIPAKVRFLIRQKQWRKNHD